MLPDLGSDREGRASSLEVADANSMEKASELAPAAGDIGPEASVAGQDFLGPI